MLDDELRILKDDKSSFIIHHSSFNILIVTFVSMEQLIRKYYRRRTFALLAIVLLGLYFYWAIPRNWRIRPDLQGLWANVNEKGDTLAWITIARNGMVKGKLGAANFESCVVLDTRGTTERFANAEPDYTLVGYLQGKMSEADTLSEREIKLPLKYDQEHLEGTLFEIRSSKPDTLMRVVLHKGR